MGDTRVGEHVGNEREHTSQPRSDERARAHGAASTIAPSHATMSARSSAGPITSA